MVGIKTEECPASKGVAYVPQRVKANSQSSVRENLEIGAVTVKSKQQIEEEMTRVMSIFPQSENFPKRKQGLLVGGQRQMLALGRGLMLKPKLLFLYELMDAAVAPQVATEVLKKEARSGIAVFRFSSSSKTRGKHSRFRIERSALLRAGLWLREDTPSAILNNEEMIRWFLGIV